MGKLPLEAYRRSAHGCALLDSVVYLRGRSVPGVAVCGRAGRHGFQGRQDWNVGLFNVEKGLAQHLPFAEMNVCLLRFSPAGFKGNRFHWTYV